MSYLVFCVYVSDAYKVMCREIQHESHAPSSRSLSFSPISSFHPQISGGRCLLRSQPIVLNLFPSVSAFFKLNCLILFKTHLV